MPVWWVARKPWPLSESKVSSSSPGGEVEPFLSCSPLKTLLGAPYIGARTITSQFCPHLSYPTFRSDSLAEGPEQPGQTSVPKGSPDSSFPEGRTAFLAFEVFSVPDLFLQKVLLHGDLDRIGLATVLGPNTALTIVCPVSLSRPVGKQGPQLSFCARETR